MEMPSPRSSNRFRLLVTTNGVSRSYLLERGENQVGSSPDCSVFLKHPTISRKHACFRCRDGQLELHDLGSSNGTFVAGERISHQVVEPGQEIRLGAVAVNLESVPQAELDVGVVMGPAAEQSATTGIAATISVSLLEPFINRYLGPLVDRLGEKDGEGFLQALGSAIFDGLPVSQVQLFNGENDAIYFSAETETVSSSPLLILEKPPLRLQLQFPIAAQGDFLQPLLLSLLGMGVHATTRRDQQVIRTVERPVVPRPPDPPTIEPVVRSLYEQAAALGDSDISVLICGETGTGKELMAQYLHAASGLDEDKFIALNCAALPEDLLELELFGIESGVATGVTARPGKFELADKGTLFLDEIGDMQSSTQAKILRVLQEQEVYRLGARKPLPARVRILAATNQDMHRAVEDGTFRRDLYHRIADAVLTLPPLRQRAADIPNLAAYFLERFCSKRGVQPHGISRACIQRLKTFNWPGNIRQLEREIARAALFLNEGDLLETSTLSAQILRPQQDRKGGLGVILADAERSAIEEALTVANGDLSTVLELLKISKSTLYRRMRTLGIESAKLSV